MKRMGCLRAAGNRNTFIRDAWVAKWQTHRTFSPWRRGILAFVGPISATIKAPCPERTEPPPECWPELPIQVDNSLAVYRIAIGAKPDKVHIAEAVIDGFEGEPDFWLERYNAMLVEKHQTKRTEI